MRKGLFILSQLSERDIEWILANGTSEEIAAGTVLIHEGKPLEALYIVLDGHLSVSVAALGNREIAKIGYGEVLGEMSFVDASPPSASVQALENSLILSIPRLLLAERLKEDLEFACRFYRAIAGFLSHRLRFTVSQLGYDVTQTLQEADPMDPVNAERSDHISLAGTRVDHILKQIKKT